MTLFLFFLFQPRDTTQDVFSGHFLFIFLKLFFCFVVAMSDLVHDVEAIFHLPYLLTAYGNLFSNMSDARETANCIFQKRFPDEVSKLQFHGHH